MKTVLTQLILYKIFKFGPRTLDYFNQITAGPFSMNSLFRLIMLKSLWFIVTEEIAHSVRWSGNRIHFFGIK